MRGRTELDTGVADMREEIETETDEMIRATIRGGGTTEGIDAMSHAGDTTMETAEMIHEDDMSEEDLEETATMICAAGMREGDMARHLIRDMATTPIRVAATKSVRGSTSRKTGTDYVMAEKDGQRIDGEEVILSPRKRGVKKFLMKSSLDDIDTVESLRRALRQPMQCSILEYLVASNPDRDELQMITQKTRIPLSEEAQVAPKADAPTVTISEVTARADRMATVLRDGMEGVPPDKFYILGSGTVEAILNDGAVLDAVIDNGSEAVIIDEDLAEQVGL
ncbi:hypothetical protein CBR_g52050 [Chara braunii]|uniref:Uncharacterized protein n=1 Tax=Chara braunii TaxID=69332 RepID=A0A388M9B1_CHABU|nr:hypothetical protein CBR_g52050 [Chara braunii]|eukprot:GBG91168.1 hypothetical protein CBR_g52050 [Chara braunii]